jgi:putative membrane protein
MMMRKTLPIVAFAGLVASTAWTQSTDTQKPAGSQAQSPAATDERFMKEAAAAGMAEVELGRLAADKASRQEIKDFARMLVDDHSKANEELKTIASQKNVTLPSEVRPEHKAEKERLSKMSGPAFDEAYTKHMVKDHQKAVDLFTRQSNAGKDPEAKAFASKTLPTIKSHLAKAQELTGDKSGEPHNH